MLTKFLLVCLTCTFSTAKKNNFAPNSNILHLTLYGNITDVEYYYVTVSIGSHKQPQALIIDTGSSLTALPCKDLCSLTSCGTHLNSLYEQKKSTDFEVLSCRGSQCKCDTTKQHCQFFVEYQEGSSYDGVVVKDLFLLDSDFKYTFGCVKQETNLLYLQKANGILGMARGGHNSVFKPIYQALYEQGLIERHMFTLCIGNNGGYLQIGNYDGLGHLKKEVDWAQLQNTDNLKVTLYGLSIKDEMVEGSEQFNVGFIDSGTTFAYFPTKLFKSIELHYQKLFQKTNCVGRLKSYDDRQLCFEFDPEQPLIRQQQFLAILPALKFKMLSIKNEPFDFEWFPSEYLHRVNQKYCLAAEKYSGSDIIMGSALIRQHNLIFDIENSQVGIVRANCSGDLEMITEKN